MQFSSAVPAIRDVFAAVGAIAGVLVSGDTGLPQAAATSNVATAAALTVQFRTGALRGDASLRLDTTIGFITTVQTWLGADANVSQPHGFNSGDEAPQYQRSRRATSSSSWR